MISRTNLTGAVIAALMAGAAVAQDDTGADTASDSSRPPAFASIDEMNVGDVLGMKAIGADGATIGAVDQVIGQGDGGAAVIGIGGLLGIGEHTVALPLDQLELNSDGTAFFVATDRQTLKAQPELDVSTVAGLPPETPIATLLQPAGDMIAPPADATTQDGPSE